MSGDEMVQGMARRLAKDARAEELARTLFPDHDNCAVHGIDVRCSCEWRINPDERKRAIPLLEAHGLRERLDEHNKFFSVMHAERIADLERRLAELEGVKEPQR